MTAESSEVKRLIDELSQVEFDTGSDIAAYTSRVRKLLKAVAMELDYGAQELEARLAELPSPEGESGAVSARKARAVARHLRRASEGATKGAIESVRTWASLERHFEHVLKPKSKKKPIDLAS